MEAIHSTHYRAILAPYMKRSKPRALGIFVLDITIYIAAIVGTIYFEGLLLKLLCSVVAGTMISALFVVGHDAAHGAFTESQTLNGLIGRIVFAPSLHNFSLWQEIHNKLHHSSPNLKGINSWSPLSIDEYRKLPGWRRLLEMLYRSPLGFGPYYLIERWWKNKFYPRSGEINFSRKWRDFIFLVAFIALFSLFLIIGGIYSTSSSAVSALFWGLLVPFIIWNYSMGWTVYIQHTHPDIPWFDDESERNEYFETERDVPHIRFPRIFGWVFHDINEHTVHHIAPKIPCYRVYEAQKALLESSKFETLSESFSVLKMFDTLSRCKLYDYRKRQWQDFAGNVTSRGYSRLRTANAF